MSEEGSFVYISMGSLSVYGTAIRGCGVFVCVAVEVVVYLPSITIAVVLVLRVKCIEEYK